MIKKISKNEIPDCVEVICKSFMTVADEFGFTIANAPRFTAFAIIRELNEELSAKGFITVAGRVSRKFFEEKFYGVAD